MSELITPGIISRLAHAQSQDEALFASQPVVQFLSIKPVDKQASAQPERYRIIISDGAYYIQAMLATQLNALVNDGTVGKHSIVRLERFTVSTVKDKRLTIILGFEILQRDAEKVGNPEALEKAEGATTPAPAAPQAATPAPAPAAAPASAPAAPAPARAPATQTRARQTYPIESLSPYQNNWTIKARVTQKSDIKRWSNQRGEGHLFNVTLMDETGEIRATAFNQVADELYPRLEEGKVYYVSRARVNLAKKKFSSVQNDYELALERNTEVEECTDTANLPQIKYNFVELKDLPNQLPEALIDVVAIVKEAGELGSITTKSTGKTIPKRDLLLVDQSGVQTRLTLWGKAAEDWAHSGAPTLACRGVKVGDFGGRSLSTLSSSSVLVNPDIPHSHHLRGWFDAEGKDASFAAQAGAGGGGVGGGGGAFRRDEFRTLHDVKEANLGWNEKGDFFSVRATIAHIKPDPVSYPGCPTCNKKVNEIGDKWRCEKCDTSYDAPRYRYMISFAATDYTDQAWLSGFNDAGEVITGITADDLNRLKEEGDAPFGAVMHKASYQTYNFLCKAKQDSYNDQTRVRYAISRIAPLDYLEEGNLLRDALHSQWAA